MIQVGILFAIAGMLLLSVSKLTARKAVASGRVLTAAAYIHGVLALTIGVLVALFGEFSLPPNIPYYLFTIAIGGAAIIPLYVAYQQQGLGLPTAIASAFAPITIFLSVVFADEQFTPRVWAGMALVFVGVFFAAADLGNWRRPKFQKGLGWAFLTMLGWGIYFFLIKRIVLSMGPWPASFALEFGVAVVVVGFAACRKALGAIPTSTTRWVALTGALDGIGVLCFYAALQFIPASIAATIMQTSVVICAVLAALFLKERFTALQKAAILVTFVGLVLVTV